MNSYACAMRTIEVVRIANLRRLVSELSKDGTSQNRIAARFEMSGPYLSQLLKGVRNKLDSPAVRKIEEGAGKPLGWMDTDFDLWPFPSIDPGLIESLPADQRFKLEGALMALLHQMADVPTNQVAATPKAEATELPKKAKSKAKTKAKETAHH